MKWVKQTGYQYQVGDGAPNVIFVRVNGFFTVDMVDLILIWSDFDIAIHCT